jgi:hypothetical protein
LAHRRDGDAVFSVTDLRVNGSKSDATKHSILGAADQTSA